MNFSKFALITLAALGTAAQAQANVVITEFMYNGSEFIEFTNIGATAVDMNGWSFDDADGVPGAQDLSAFGTVAAGESVILSEETATAFRTRWNLSLSVKVIGGNANNLGRNDTINLYDADDNLVDTLDYGDQTFPGTIRTDVRSGNTAVANYGDNTIGTWVLASASGSDSFGSYTSVTGSFRGNPGTALVPEPGSVVSLLAGLASLAVCHRARRRR